MGEDGRRKRKHLENLAPKDSPSDEQPSDSEILERQFDTDDPEQLPGLRSVLPANFSTAAIEYWYDLSPPKGLHRDYVWCAHDKKATHWRGYVMKTLDGVRFLLTWRAQTCSWPAPIRVTLSRPDRALFGPYTPT